MLAKKLKIRNIKQQREFIKYQLEMLLENPREDGRVDYQFIGYIFPEVIDYFHEQGFNVEITKVESGQAKIYGRSVYIFTPSDEIKLSEEEIERSEKFELIDFENEKKNDEEVLKALEDILGMYH